MQEENFFLYSGIAKKNNELWYITENNNFLMKINYNNGSADCECKIPYTENLPLAYRGLSIKNNKLYLIPFNSDALCIYDIKEKKCEFINIPLELFDKQKKTPQFYEAVWYEDSLIMVGLTRYVLIFHEGIREFEVIDLEYDKNGDIEWIVKYPFVCKNKLYCIIHYTNTVFSVDLNTKKVKKEIIGRNKREYIYTILLKYNDDLFYFVEEFLDGRVRIQAVKTNNISNPECIVKFELNNEIKYKKAIAPFLCASICCEKMILFPGYCEECYQISINNGNINNVKITSRSSKWHLWYSMVDISISNQDIATILPDEKCLLSYNGEFNKKKIKLTEAACKTIREEYKRLSKKGDIIKEDKEVFKLNDFIKEL